MDNGFKKKVEGLFTAEARTMNKREAIFEMLKGRKARRSCWAEKVHCYMDERGVIYLVDKKDDRTELNFNYEFDSDWVIYEKKKETKANYKDALIAFVEGKTVVSPEGVVFKFDELIKENEGREFKILH